MHLSFQTFDGNVESKMNMKILLKIISPAKNKIFNNGYKDLNPLINANLHCISLAICSFINGAELPTAKDSLFLDRVGWKDHIAMI